MVFNISFIILVLCRNDNYRGEGRCGRVGGELLNDVKFANDQEMVAHTEKRL